MSEARNEPRASAPSSGSVIMHRDLNAFLLHNNHRSVVPGQLGLADGIFGKCRVAAVEARPKLLLAGVLSRRGGGAIAAATGV